MLKLTRTQGLQALAAAVPVWIGYVAVERINGSFYTVMGLPLHRVYLTLKQLATPAAE